MQALPLECPLPMQIRQPIRSMAVEILTLEAAIRGTRPTIGVNEGIGPKHILKIDRPASPQREKEFCGGPRPPQNSFSLFLAAAGSGSELPELFDEAIISNMKPNVENLVWRFDLEIEGIR